MRLPVLLLLVSGCFNPQIPSGGFACTPEHPECPQGFSCINGSCLSDSDPFGPEDLSLADDLASRPLITPGKPKDMAP